MAVLVLTLCCFCVNVIAPYGISYNDLVIIICDTMKVSLYETNDVR